REHLVLDDALLVVDVADEQVQRLGALLEPRFGALPLAARDGARDHVEGPGAIDVAPFRVHREGDAHRLDGEVGGQAALVHLAVRQTGEVIDERARRRPRRAGRFEQLVVELLATVLAPVDGHAALWFSPRWTAS